MPRRRRTQELFWANDRGLRVLLVVLLVSIFIVSPLVLQEDLELPRVLFELFYSLIAISGVAAVSGRKSTTALVVVFAVVSLAVRFARLASDSPLLLALNATASLAFCALMTVLVLAQVLREGPVTRGRIEGAIAAYLLLGLMFSFGYDVVFLTRPHAFQMTEIPENLAEQKLATRMVYFSFVTLTTVGYGDVTAIDPIARTLVIMEALIGQLFPAVLLARLVSLELYDRERSRGSDKG